VNHSLSELSTFIFDQFPKLLLKYLLQISFCILSEAYLLQRLTN